MEKGKGTTSEENRSTPTGRGTDFKVPYSRANVNRCKCPQCPVQADSKCAQDKIQNLKTVMSNVSGEGVPNPEDVPGVYCSTGKATCKDLNPDRSCICNTCDVWKEYTLGKGKPVMYFCKNGKAA